MAAMDYGVLIFKNKTLLIDKEISKDRAKFSQGEAGYLALTNIAFDREMIMISKDEEVYKDYVMLYNDCEIERKYITYHLNDLLSKKKVLRLAFSFENKNISTKTKKIGDLFLTTFSINQNKYSILQGYDVGLEYFHNRKTQKLLQKTIKRITR